jgi:transposase InsO family protein
VDRLYGHRFATLRQAIDEVIDWMTFYNHRRTHSTWDNVSQIQFERSWLAGRLRRAA